MTFCPLFIPLLFTGDTLNQALDFVPLLIQIVEKAAPQSSQLALSEAVAASLLLCHLSMLDSIPGKALKHNSFLWSVYECVVDLSWLWIFIFCIFIFICRI